MKFFLTALSALTAMLLAVLPFGGSRYVYLAPVALSLVLGVLGLVSIVRLTRSEKKLWWLLSGPIVVILALVIADDLGRLASILLK